jgi:hypothetical protein
VVRSAPAALAHPRAASKPHQDVRFALPPPLVSGFMRSYFPLVRPGQRGCGDTGGNGGAGDPAQQQCMPGRYTRTPATGRLGQHRNERRRPQRQPAMHMWRHLFCGKLPDGQGMFVAIYKVSVDPTVGEGFVY